MTLETEVAGLTFATTRLLDAVNVSKETLFSAQREAVSSASIAQLAAKNSTDALAGFTAAAVSVLGGVTHLISTQPVVLEESATAEGTKKFIISMPPASSTVDGFMSASDKSKVDGIEQKIIDFYSNKEPAGSTKVHEEEENPHPQYLTGQEMVDFVESNSPVLSVNGETGKVVLSSKSVGLEKVANVAPIDMPISREVQKALDSKTGDGSVVAHAQLENPHPQYVTTEYLATKVNIDAPVLSVNGMGGNVKITAKSFDLDDFVGLNPADLPISNLTQQALDSKSSATAIEDHKGEVFPHLQYAEVDQIIYYVQNSSPVLSVNGKGGHIIVVSSAEDIGLDSFSGLTPLTLPVSTNAGLEMARIAATVTPERLDLAPFVGLTPARLPLSNAALVEADNKTQALMGIAANLVSTQAMLVSAVAAFVVR